MDPSDQIGRLTSNARYTVVTLLLLVSQLICLIPRRCISGLDAVNNGLVSLDLRKVYRAVF